ncbi:MAG TPA: hypothetical protein DF698_03120, partial [Candidatus Atribacteria bacterium]|nr:hypothetical protein [Candidatus Atribacteria bacterium]
TGRVDGILTSLYSQSGCVTQLLCKLFTPIYSNIGDRQPKHGKKYYVLHFHAILDVRNELKHNQNEGFL